MKSYRLQPRDPALKIKVSWSNHTESFCASIINRKEGRHVMTLGYIQRQCVNLDDFTLRLKPYAYMTANVRRKLEADREAGCL